MNYVFTGDKTGFGPLTSELLNKYLCWINDFEVTKYLTPTLRNIFTKIEIEDWYHKAISNDKQRWFTIYELKNDDAIGCCHLEVEELDQRGGLFILIGEKNLWNKGYGTEATFLLLDYGFTVLSLETINLNVMEKNTRARQVFQNLGFQENGRQRKFMRLNGNFFDRIWMDILREEFFRKHKSIIDTKHLKNEEQTKQS